jgi:hypothetical protein
LPEDGLDDVEFEQFLEDRNHVHHRFSGPTAFKRRISGVVGEALSICESVVGKSSAIDYIETACSFLDKVHTDYNEIRNIVTGGAVDGWYQASFPVTSPPSSLGTMLCCAPFVPIPAQITSCMALANQMVMPSSAVNARATEVCTNEKVLQQTEIPVACDSSAIPASQRTRLRSEAGLFQPRSNEQKEDTPAEAAQPTTLMLRNIPKEATRSMLLDILRSAGLANHIAFIYLPMNLRSPGNFGYAFVDFDCTQVAELCKNELQGFSGWSGVSDMALEVVWSETQGLDSLVQRYRDSPLMHKSLEDEFKPAIFKNGVRITFPPPTKFIRAPRLRK